MMKWCEITLKTEEELDNLRPLLNAIYGPMIARADLVTRNRKAIDQYRAFVAESVRDILVSKDDERDYFRFIGGTYDQAEWRHLLPEAKISFFELWFSAISDPFLKSVLSYKNKDMDFMSAAHSLYPEPVWTDVAHDPLFYSIYAAFGLPPTLDFLSAFLVTAWTKGGVKIGGYGLFRHVTLWPAAEITEVARKREEPLIKEYEKYISKSSNSLSGARGEGPILTVNINLEYHEADILRAVSRIVKRTQPLYFRKYPDRERYFIKKTSNNTVDTKHRDYDYDVWEQSLKTYIVNKQGKKALSDLKKSRFGPNVADPDRQIQREIKRAKELSQSSIEGRFPAAI